MAKKGKTKSCWRDQILKQFQSGFTKLILVSDPDGLIVEEQMAMELDKQGFDIIEFEDSIAFRYLYELRYRSHWDRGKKTKSLIVVSKEQAFFEKVPYDLLQIGQRLSLSLAELFPNLSYCVVSQINKADLDYLYDAQQMHCHGEFDLPTSVMLGENATKDFILRHVYHTAPELIQSASDLLWVLLRKHYKAREIPRIIDIHFIKILKQKAEFKDWPLESIVPDREAFLLFLQERWPVFLDMLTSQQDDSIRQVSSRYSFEYDGPVILPFEHRDVRIYIDNLFTEGLLQPVEHDRAGLLIDTWAGVGVIDHQEDNQTIILEKLFQIVTDSIPSPQATYDEWLAFATKWGELISIVEKRESSDKHKEKLEILKTCVDPAFTSWCLQHYSTLINLPATTPVMVHHVPRYLSRKINDRADLKICLLVLDGLSMDQWFSARRVLRGKNPKLRLKERAIFGWVPTITSVSRQAIFAGNPPIFFPTAIHGKVKETELWRKFWTDEGLNQHQIAYLNVVGDTAEITEISEMLDDTRVKVFGLVIRKADRIMHGIELGTKGMHNQIVQWINEGFMLELLEVIRKTEFEVYLTSDHGNIEAVGIGQPREGMVAEKRGERVRVYTDKVLRKEIRKLFLDSIEWPNIGLPERYYPLIASDRTAFVPKNNRIVGHGGITVEELIVPFVKIGWRNS